jgi:branched-subunit amino acid ABC-type transport system permease component
MLLEKTLLKTLYARDHMSQVLATFALILILNESVKIATTIYFPLAQNGHVYKLFGLDLGAVTWRLYKV